MSYRPAVNYYYDGTYDGFLCCVFESYAEKEMPAGIFTEDQADQTSLFGGKRIETDEKRARRVRASIPAQMGMAAQDLLEHAFLTALQARELHMLRFMQLGYRVGLSVTNRLTDPCVDVLVQAVRHLHREAELYLGFVRFAQCDRVLIAQITPKNNVLPVIAPHFLTRFSGEDFMIFDRTHKVALLHQDGVHRFLQADRIELPPCTPEEAEYQQMWRTFYDTVRIEGRRNEVCRRTHMPKRYWQDLTELQEQV